MQDRQIGDSAMVAVRDLERNTRSHKANRTVDLVLADHRIDAVSRHQSTREVLLGVTRSKREVDRSRTGPRRGARL